MQRVRGTTTGYVPALDGLRGVAVLLVLAHHVREIYFPSFAGSFFRGGFLGVDIFFVLSGYLITGILLNAHKRGGVGFLSFYRGRVMRLFPALVAFLAAQMLYAWVVGIPRSIEQSTVLSVLLYYNNWRRTIVTGEGTQHLWTLSVEEQFYLVWPLALVALLAATRGRRRWVAAVVVAAIAAVVIGRAWGWHNGTLWVWLYVGTATRADSLLVGVLLAIAVSRLSLGNRRWLAPAAWIATAFLGLCIAFGHFDRSPLYLGGFTLVALASATVVLAALPGTTWPGVRPLQWAPLCTLGVVSYGIYIWHGLVFAGVQHWGTSLPNVARAVIALTVTALVTYLSWVLVEQPFLRWKSRLDRGRDKVSTPAPTVAPSVANGQSAPDAVVGARPH